MTVIARPLDPPLAEVFKALADPTRLAVVERLGLGPATTTELARPFTMALPSFSQHLDVLEHCGLVSSAKQGRVRIYRLTPAPLEQAGTWLVAQREHWNRRLDQLDELLRNMPTECPNQHTNPKDPT